MEIMKFMFVNYVCFYVSDKYVSLSTELSIISWAVDYQPNYNLSIYT